MALLDFGVKIRNYKQPPNTEIKNLWGRNVRNEITVGGFFVSDSYSLTWEFAELEPITFPKICNILLSRPIPGRNQNLRMSQSF